MDWPDSPEAAPLGDGRRAVAVDRPATAEELRAVVGRRASEGAAIYPQGGRTALDYGGIPSRPGVALDMTALDAVIDYPAADMTITVEAGITLAKLQDVLATEGQFLPMDAPDPDRATLGGIYATNTCGPRRFGWGRPRDMIIGVGFVTADGKSIKGGGRVVKNVAGYDFPKLMTGSMGTLGAISQMTLKVRPKPEASAVVLVPFDRHEDLQRALETLNTSVARPVVMDVLNRPAALLAGIEGVEAPYLLALGFEDNAASVSWQVENVEVPRGDRRILLGDEAGAVYKALAQFAALDGGALGLVVSLPRSKGLEFVETPEWEGWACRLHAGNGVIHAHSQGGSLGEGLDEMLIDSLRSKSARLGGSLILSRCPTEWKDRLGVWGDRRGDWAVMERIKAALDPAGVMNPGRFVGTI